MKLLRFAITVECPDDMVPGTVSHALSAWLSEGQRAAIKEHNVSPSIRATSRSLKFKRLEPIKNGQLELNL